MDGKKHGVGIYKFKNGDYYHGNWEFNRKNGKGIFFNS